VDSTPTPRGFALCNGGVLHPKPNHASLENAHYHTKANKQINKA